MRLLTQSPAALLCAALILAPAAAGAASRSEDDRGFSILLTSPSEAFLAGTRTLHIEAIIPRGDRMEQVDFFLDGRLLATDRKEPYETEADFGRDIRRHTVEVRATTHAGRRARVTLISRSADMAEGAVVKVIAIPVVAFRSESDYLDDLGVSDILVTEDGAPRDLIQFAPGPFPASIAVVLGAGGDDWHDLAAEAARFAHALPDPDAVALVDAPLGGPEAIATAFSFDRSAVADRLAASAAPAPGGLAARIGAAATALGGRRGPRVLLVLLTGAESGSAALEDPSAAALETALETGVVVYAVALGPDETAVPEALRDAADRSGGAVHAAAETAGFSRALQEVAAELRHRYLLAFTPAEEARSGWRAVRVRLRGHEGGVRAPRSVYVP
ncbi:MAG TPA: hypothetical protein VMQ62_15710 [Dongiaceae bacterium]|nr:hypothetical protein [Dongiaceae bacterium]